MTQELAFFEVSGREGRKRSWLIQWVGSLLRGRNWRVMQELVSLGEGDGRRAMTESWLCEGDDGRRTMEGGR